MHVARRAIERHATGFLEAAQSADAMLLEEAAEPGSGVRHVRRVLQLLLANPEAWQEWREAVERGHDGWNRRARLEL